MSDNSGEAGGMPAGAMNTENTWKQIQQFTNANAVPRQILLSLDFMELPSTSTYVTGSRKGETANKLILNSHPLVSTKYPDEMRFPSCRAETIDTHEKSPT